MGTTPLRISCSDQERAIIRCIQVLPTFDCIGIATMTLTPFGSVSRIMAMLENEGYVAKTGNKVVYNSAALKRNPELWNFRFNYGNSTRPGSREMQKTKEWPSFMHRWSAEYKKRKSR